MFERSAPRKQTANVATIPAPVGGWNARDALPNMEPTDAIILDNWLPTTAGIVLRPGYTTHATGLGASVETLMTHSAPSGTNTMFGAAGTAIYDVTSAGAVGAAAVSSTGNARWIHTMFATSGGNFLVCANGGTGVRNYSGAAWTTPTINNVTSANLSFVTSHASRLFFIEKNTLKAWYLPVSSISGDAASLDFGPYCKLGGALAALTSWTRDGGSGSDDVFVAITTRGEVLLYTGSDPSDADFWSLIGVFRIPEPIGSRCVIKIGADVAILTSAGALPLSAILSLTSTGAGQAAATDKIRGAFRSAYIGSGTTFGWQLIEYPKRGILLVNVPDGTKYRQFAMNIQTGAWARLKDIEAICWGMKGDSIYFGDAAGKVRRWDVDNDDDGAAIIATAMPAFQNLDTPLRKQVTMARPLYSAIPGTNIPVQVKVDYDTTDAAFTYTTIIAPGSPWDTSPWDTSPWGAAIGPISVWQGAPGYGQVISPVMSVSSTSPVTLNQTDLMFHVGGPL